MRSKVFFLILLISLSSVPIVEALSEYGEDSPGLDQFVDDFENENYISTKDVVIRNASLNCMELNYTELSILSGDIVHLREHDNYAAYEPNQQFALNAGEYLRTYTVSTALGDGYNFIVFDSAFLEGKYIRLRWKWDSNYILFRPCYFRVFDGTYNRNNDTHFPDDSGIITFGAGLLYSLREIGTENTWYTREYFMDLDSWGHTEDNVTVMLFHHDGSSSYYDYMYVDWIEINSESGGSGNIFTIDFKSATNVVMEVTGTDGDYGYVNNTGLPLTSGGYLDEGYFTTVDYLDYATGSSLVLMTNSNIPSGTEIRVQFSLDNSTWVNNQNVSGYNTLTGGFESLDLRDLNFSDIYIKYTFKGSSYETSRLYQSRLVSTGPIEENGITVVESDAPWIAIAIILSIISGLLFTRMRR